MTRYTPLWEQAGSYAAAVDRRLIGALWPAAASVGCAVSTSSGMTVNVAAGQVSVPTANNTGSVLCSSDAVEPVTLAAAPGAGTNRYDVVICQARGNDLDGGANNDFLFTTVTGTAAASPTVPATPANAVALANIYVPGGSASVTAGNITDVRPGMLALATSDRRTVLGYAERTTASAAITTETSLAMDLTVTVAANRRIELAVAATGANGTAGGQVWMSIKEGGTYITQHRGTVAATNWSNPFNLFRVITPTAGSHTYSVTIAASPQPAAWVADATSQPISFKIQDLGPV